MCNNIFLHVFSPYYAAVHHDLIICNAFCRIGDEIVDSTTKPIEEKERFVRILRKFLDELFANRVVHENLRWTDIKTKTDDNKIDWNYLGQHLNDDEIIIFRCLSRIVYYLPQEPFYDMLAGFETDLKLGVIANTTELRNYCANAANSLTMFIFICCHKNDCWPSDINERFDSMFKKIRTLCIVSIQPYH